MAQAIEIPLAKLLVIRQFFNVILGSGRDGSVRFAKIETPQGSFIAYSTGETDDATLDALDPVANLPITIEEYRFATHLFNNAASWDGRTTGNPAKTWSLANGATHYDDVNYRWLDAANAPVSWLDRTTDGIGSIWRKASDRSEVAKYVDTAKKPVWTNPAVLTGVTILAVERNLSVEPVAGSYDLTVTTGTNSGYRFTWNGVDLDDTAWAANAVNTIDGGVAGAITFKLGAAAPSTVPQTDAITLVTYAGRWLRLDTGVDVTSSDWAIVPYPNYKMLINQANSQFHSDAMIQPVGGGVAGAMRYTVYKYLTQEILISLGYGQIISGTYYGAPAGVYPGRVFVYPTTEVLRLAADAKFLDTNDVWYATYNYSLTTPPVIDSLTQMSMVISLDGHLPVVSENPAQGEFIGLKVASF